MGKLNDSATALRDLVVIPGSTCRNTRIRSVELLISNAETYAVGWSDEVSKVSKLTYLNESNGADDIQFCIDSDFRVQGTGTLETLSDSVERISGKINGEAYCLEFNEVEDGVVCKQAPGLPFRDFMLLLEWS